MLVGCWLSVFLYSLCFGVFLCDASGLGCDFGEVEYLLGVFEMYYLAFYGFSV